MIAGEGLTSEVITMAQTGKRVGRWGCWNWLAQNGLEPLDYELLGRSAPVRRYDLRAFKDVVGQVNGGFHSAINTAYGLMSRVVSNRSHQPPVKQPGLERIGGLQVGQADGQGIGGIGGRGLRQA